MRVYCILNMELFVLRFRLSSRLKRSRLKFLFLALYSILSSNREIERESLRFFFLSYFKYGYLKVVFQVLPCIGSVLFSYRMKIPLLLR